MREANRDEQGLTVKTVGLPTRRHQIPFAEAIRDGDRRIIDAYRRETGIDLSGHKPESLEVIDRYVNKGFRDAVNQSPDKYEAASTALGSFLGEVIVHNLGGNWHYPTYLQSLRVVLSRKRFKGAAYWYVALGDEKINVFLAAREAIDRTSKGFSLYAYYERFAQRVRVSTLETSPRGP